VRSLFQRTEEPELEPIEPEMTEPETDQDLTVADEPMPVAADAGVTPSADWDDYSAPI
jgi:hypothetical protein